MRTLIKMLLFVCWLLGAEVGFSTQGGEAAGSSEVYRYTVTEGIDLVLHENHVALRIEGRALSTSWPRFLVRSAAYTTSHEHLPRHGSTPNHRFARSSASPTFTPESDIDGLAP